MKDKLFQTKWKVIYPLTHTQKRLCWVFLFLLWTFSYFIQGGGFNQNSTIGEIREFAERGTVDITPWRPITGDISEYAGKTFSNKCPSSFFFAAPLYFVVYRTALTLRIDTTSPNYQMFASQFITVCCASFWGALLGPLLYYILSLLYPSFSTNEKVALATTMPLSTLVFPYSTVAFAHVFETFWICVLGLTWLNFYAQPRVRSHQVFLGLAIGMSVLSNSINVIVAGFIFLVILARYRDIRSLITIGLSSGVAMAPQLIYNQINFDLFWHSNRLYLSGFTDKSLFLGVLGAPELSRLVNIFGVGHRSIFPGHLYLLLALTPMAIRSRENFDVWRVMPVIAVIVVELMFLTSFNGWHGGSAFGPRYATAGLMLLSIFAASSLKVYPRLFWWAIAVGIGTHFVVTTSNIFPGESDLHPWRDLILPRFLTGTFREASYPLFIGSSPGDFKLNLGHLFHLKKWKTFLPLILIQILIVIKIDGSRSVKDWFELACEKVRSLYK